MMKHSILYLVAMVAAACGSADFRAGTDPGRPPRAEEAGEAGEASSPPEGDAGESGAAEAGSGGMAAEAGQGGATASAPGGGPGREGSAGSPASEGGTSAGGSTPAGGAPSAGGPQGGSSGGGQAGSPAGGAAPACDGGGVGYRMCDNPAVCRYSQPDVWAVIMGSHYTAKGATPDVYWSAGQPYCPGDQVSTIVVSSGTQYMYIMQCVSTAEKCRAVDAYTTSWSAGIWRTVEGSQCRWGSGGDCPAPKYL